MTANKQNETFSRIYFPELDGLRFVAFLLVFIHHHGLFAKTPGLSSLHKFGWVGVDFFFALSAFLFTKLLIAEYQQAGTISFRKFYIRRIFRIWPAYFFYILLSIGLYIFFYHSHISSYMWLRIAGLFSFSDNIMGALYGVNPLPGTMHLWTVTFEEQIYLVIPLIILLLLRSSFKKKLVIATSVFIVCSLIRFVMIAVDIPHPAVWVLPVTHFESILLGIVIGFGGFDFLLKKTSALTIGVISLACFALLFSLPPIGAVSYWMIASLTVAGLATSLLLFAVFNSPALKKFFSHKTLIFLGRRSYGMYLYHLLSNDLALLTIEKIPLLPGGQPASFLYSLLLTTAMAIISYKFIETPFLRWKTKYEVVHSRPV